MVLNIFEESVYISTLNWCDVATIMLLVQKLLYLHFTFVFLECHLQNRFGSFITMKLLRNVLAANTMILTWSMIEFFFFSFVSFLYCISALVEHS